MNREFKQHRIAYGILAVVLVVFLVLFFAAWPNKLLQRILIILIGIFYVGWGSVTHVKTDHLTKQVFYEYLGVAVLSALILLLVTF